MGINHREDSITGIRRRDALKTKVANSAAMVDGSIVLELPDGGVWSGTMVKFIAPCECTAVTGGIVIDGTTYTVVDALGHIITGKGGYWAKNAAVAVMIDAESHKAFVTNAAGVCKGGDTMIGELRAGEDAQDPTAYLVRNSSFMPKADYVAEKHDPKIPGQILWLYK